MDQYRAYHIGEDDHYLTGFDLDCGDDEAAIEMAKRLADGHEVELWQGSRMVVRLQVAK